MSFLDDQLSFTTSHNGRLCLKRLMPRCSWPACTINHSHYNVMYCIYTDLCDRLQSAVIMVEWGRLECIMCALLRFLPHLGWNMPRSWKFYFDLCSSGFCLATKWFTELMTNAQTATDSIQLYCTERWGPKGMFFMYPEFHLFQLFQDICHCLLSLQLLLKKDTPKT